MYSRLYILRLKIYFVKSFGWMKLQRMLLSKHFTDVKRASHIWWNFFIWNWIKTSAFYLSQNGNNTNWNFTTNNWIYDHLNQICCAKQNKLYFHVIKYTEAHSLCSRGRMLSSVNSCCVSFPPVLSSSEASDWTVTEAHSWRNSGEKRNPPKKQQFLKSTINVLEMSEHKPFLF